MPIYEFRCRNCQNIFEFFFRALPQKIELTCPMCRSDALEKIFSTPALVSANKASRNGLTCCGQQERCETPPCSEGRSCRRDTK